MQTNELEELKAYIRKVIRSKKLKQEGSSTAGVPGYATPYAFAGPGKEPGKKALEADDTYTEKPSPIKRNFIKIHEVSYKTFKEDQSMTDVKKVNQAILEINRRIREINRTLDHSMKLKNESKMGDEKLWKKTNEALVKISNRMNEAAKKMRKFANLKEIQANQAKDKLMKAFQLAQLPVEDSEARQDGSTIVIDIYMHGEPYGFDIKNNIVYYQDYSNEVEVGNLDNQNQLADGLKRVLSK